jgi:L-lactate dehydrogenase complex protein LldG
MTSPRAEIFGRLQRSLGRETPSESQRRELDLRTSTPPRNLIPAYAQQTDVIALFAKMAPLSAATLTRVPDWSLVPKEVTAYTRLFKLPSQAVVSLDDEFKDLPWRDAVLTTRFGAAERNDVVGVSLAHAGIAETGTIVETSSADHPMSINLLPENHISILPASRIVATYEDLWDKFRETYGPGTMPRTAIWITGPSRTADVGQQMLFGAHGPVREHIIIVEGA